MCGVSDEIITALKGNWRSAGLADKVQAMLAYAEQVTCDATQVHEEHLNRMRRSGCTDEEILEATVVAAFFNCLDRVADALGVRLDELPG